MVRFRLFLSSCIILLCITTTANAQNDFDGDQISDFTWTLAGTTLTWKTNNSTSATDLNTEFGLGTDLIALAHWEGESTPNLALVRSNANNTLVWKVLLSNNTIDQRTFGKPGDVVISGADFDGNGVTDAALVRYSKKSIVWTVQYNMFTESNKPKRVKFGTMGDRVFFLNPGSDHDWMGVFGLDAKGHVHFLLRDPANGHITKVKGIAKSLAKGTRPRPFAIREEDGSDAIGFVTQDQTDTTLAVYSLDGTLIRRVTFPGLGNVAVGNYDPDQPGNEVIIQTSTTMIIYNPFSANLSHGTVLGGAPVDETNIGTPGVGTALSTPIPTPSPH